MRKSYRNDINAYIPPSCFRTTFYGLSYRHHRISAQPRASSQKNSLIGSKHNMQCMCTGKTRVHCRNHKFCHRPSSLFAQAPKIGGTKTVSIQDVEDLGPDIVLANKEENTKEDIEALRARGITVFCHLSPNIRAGLI